MSLRTRVGVETPLPLAGQGTRGSEATGAFSPLHCLLLSPRPCHACGSLPFTHLHDTRPCESRALGPRCGAAEREPFTQCQDAAFPGRESRPSCLLHSLHLRAFAQDSPIPRGTHPVALSAGLSPSWGLCFGTSCEASPGTLSSLAFSVSFGDSQCLLVMGTTEGTMWEGSVCPGASREFQLYVL